MPRYAVTIPQWSDGCSLRMEVDDVYSADQAEAKVVDWVNRRAGYHYCDRLPPGTRIVGPPRDWREERPVFLAERLDQWRSSSPAPDGAAL